MSEINALTAAIRSKLTNDVGTGGLRATSGTPLIPSNDAIATGLLPARQSYPYISIDLVSQVDASTFGLDGFTNRFSLHVVTQRSDGLEDAADIVQRVIEVLHRTTLVISGDFVNEGVLHVSTIPQHTQSHYHFVVDFVTRTHKTA